MRCRRTRIRSKRTPARQQRGDRDQSGRLDPERERGRHHRECRRRHPTRDDGPFDQHVGDQGAGGDLAFGPQSVVEGHPRRQQDQAGGPQRGLARRDRRAEPGQHFARQQEPADDSAHQVGQPHPDAGIADAGHHRQQVVVPAERIFGTAEPAEVVRHVAGVPGDPGHAEDVAVVRRVRTDDVPHQEGADHGHVGRGERAPSLRNQPVHPPAVETVQPPQREQGDGGRERSPAPSRRASEVSAWWRTACRSRLRR